MKLEGIIGVLMVLLAIAALVIWETGTGKRVFDAIEAAGGTEADEALGGQDVDLPGAASDSAAMFWAGQGDFTGTLGHNSQPWMGSSQ